MVVQDSKIMLIFIGYYLYLQLKEKILVILLRPCITDLVLAREYHLVRVPMGSFVFSGVFRCCGSLGDQFQV